MKNVVPSLIEIGLETDMVEMAGAALLILSSYRTFQETLGNPRHNRCKEPSNPPSTAIKTTEEKYSRVWSTQPNPPGNEKCRYYPETTHNTSSYNTTSDSEEQKSRSEEKVVGLSSASLFPARKQEAFSQVGTMELG